MARQEELLERYEDALFTLLMNGVAEAEGKRLLEENAELKKDPTAAVPEKVNKRCLKTINRAFARENARAVRRTGKRVLQRAAIVIAATFVLVTAACAINPTLRAKTFNLLIQVSELATSMQMKEDAGVPAVPEDEGVMLMGYRFPNPPEGFEKVQEIVKDQYELIVYQDEVGAEITFSVRTAESRILDVDTEEAQYAEAIVIHGYEGMLTEKQYEFEGEMKNRISVTWGDKEQNMFLQVMSFNLSRGMAVDLAQQVEVVNTSEK